MIVYCTIGNRASEAWSALTLPPGLPGRPRLLRLVVRMGQRARHPDRHVRRLLGQYGGWDRQHSGRLDSKRIRPTRRRFLFRQRAARFPLRVRWLAQTERLGEPVADLRVRLGERRAAARGSHRSLPRPRDGRDREQAPRASRGSQRPRPPPQRRPSCVRPPLSCRSPRPWCASPALPECALPTWAAANGCCCCRDALELPSTRPDRQRRGTEIPSRRRS